MGASQRKQWTMKNPKPTWWSLYALLPLAIVLLVAAHGWLPGGGGRASAEAVVSLAAMGAIAVWVRANRLALALRGEPGEQAQSLRAWVAYQPPAPPERRADTATSEYKPQIAA